MNTDAELLRQYARDGSEEAFRELVERHMNLVWAAAWRVTGNREMAQDVAQCVFASLARKARWLPSQTILAGWLYRAAWMAAAKAVRTNARRQKREQEAMELHPMHNEETTQAEDESLLPLLDDALGRLSETDRTALVLRFFSKKSLAEVGAAFGVSDDTAQKRVSRAIEKLRGHFRRSGHVLSGSALISLLGLAGSQTAPAGVAAAVAVSSISLAGAAGSSWIALFSTLPSHITAMKTQITIAALATAAISTPLVHQHSTLAALRHEQAGLQERVSSLDEVRARHAELLETARLAAELERLKQEELEVLRLRREREQLENAGGPDLIALHSQWQSAQALLDQARAQRIRVQEEIEHQHLNERVINELKNLGLAARIFATDNADTLPLTFDDMQNELSPEIDLDRYEFAPHARVIAETEPQMILFWEKEPRRTPDGRWVRIYCLADGSVQVRSAPTLDELLAWERKHLALEP